MTQSIQEESLRRGITRLCHFTPSRNLLHIAEDPRGILASKHLMQNERELFNPTDRQRFDGHPDHVCCSIQYPNAWYFEKARGRERLFADWVILLIAPHYLWSAETRFCPQNAAKAFGVHVASGPEAFRGIFASTVVGSADRTYRRAHAHPSWLPTDEQAEVLIPDRIAKEDILGVIVYDAAQAKREQARLAQLGARMPPLAIAPALFEARTLSRMIRQGLCPPEVSFPAKEA